MKAVTSKVKKNPTAQAEKKQPFFSKKKEPYATAHFFKPMGLEVAAANDPLEVEAERNAEQSVRYGKPTGRTKANAAYSGHMTSGNGMGKPLDPQHRVAMEHALGADFSRVRIHDNEAAARQSKQLDAAAFTKGNDIFFDRGKYDTQSVEGKKLLAHELTHVKQQSPKVHRKPASDLSDLSKTDSKELLRDTQILDPAEVNPKLKEWFATSPKLAGGATERIPEPGDETSFSTNIRSQKAAAGYDIQRGLKSTAGFIHRNMTPSPLAVNKSVSIDLDLSPFGGTAGIYRFTHYDTGKKNEQTALLIELTGKTAVAATATMPAVDADFDAQGSNFKLVNTWQQDEFNALKQALNTLPAKGLKMVAGLSFARASDVQGDEEGGHYNSETFTITIRDRAFSKNMARYGNYTSAIRVIAHEVGHAIDTVPTEKAFQEYQKTGKEKELLSAASYSGMQYVKEQPEEGEAPVFSLTESKKDTEFRKAVKADRVKGGPDSITDYGNTSYEESFAEAFSFYTTEPDTFKQLRPKTYEYFKKNFG